MPYQPMLMGPSCSRMPSGVIGINPITWLKGNTRGAYLYSLPMTEQYIGWALVLGLAIGGTLVWLAVGRLPRSGEELSADERASEAAWISDTITENGGAAPPDLVEEVLDLHVRYLERAEMEGG